MSLSMSQRRALSALLTSKTLEEAAAQAKISSRTLRSYLKNAEFRCEYGEVMAQLVADAAAQARRGMGEAISLLREMLGDADVSPNVRVQAARTILESGGKLIEMQSLEARIAALEEREGRADEREP